MAAPHDYPTASTVIAAVLLATTTLAADTPADRAAAARVQQARDVLKLRAMMLPPAFAPSAATPSPRQTLAVLEAELAGATSVEPLLPLLHPAVARDYWFWRMDARYFALASGEADWVRRYENLFARVQSWGETRYEMSPPRAIVSVRLDDRDPRPDGRPLSATTGVKYEFLLEGAGPLWRFVTVRPSEDAVDDANPRFAANPLGRADDNLEPPPNADDRQLPEDRVLTDRLRDLRKAAHAEARQTSRPSVSPEQTVAALSALAEGQPAVDDILTLLSSGTKIDYVRGHLEPTRRRPLKTDDDWVRYYAKAFGRVVGFVGTTSSPGEARVRYVVRQSDHAFVEYEATLVPEAGVWRVDHVAAQLWRNHATPGLRTLARR